MLTKCGIFRAVLPAIVLLAACRVTPPWPPRDEDSPRYLRVHPATAIPEVRWSSPCDAPGIPAEVSPRERLHPLYSNLQEVPGSFPMEDEYGGALLIERGWLSCRDAHTGELRWSRPLRSADCQVLPSAGSLFLHEPAGPWDPFSETHARLLRLDPADGNSLGVLEGLHSTDLMLGSSGRIYLVSIRRASAIDGISGSWLWQREFPHSIDSSMQIVSAAAGPGGLALQILSSGRSLPQLILHHPDDGRPLWTGHGRPLSVGDDLVFSVSVDSGGFTARGAAGGEPIQGGALEGWQEMFEHATAGIVLYVARQRVITPAHTSVGPEGASERPSTETPRLELLALDPVSAKVRWFVPCPGGDPRLRFLVSGDRVGMITGAGIANRPEDERLEVFDLESGVPLWSAIVPREILKVGIRKDRALIRSRDGWVYAIEWTRR